MESGLARLRSSSSSEIWDIFVVRITASPSAHEPIKQRVVKAKKNPLLYLLFITTHLHVPLFSHNQDILLKIGEMRSWITGTSQFDEVRTSSTLYFPLNLHLQNPQSKLGYIMQWQDVFKILIDAGRGKKKETCCKRVQWISNRFYINWIITSCRKKMTKMSRSSKDLRRSSILLGFGHLEACPKELMSTYILRS